MNTSTFLLFICLSLGSISYAQERVTGIVYDDANKNGKRDRQETVLENIAVSNGYDVVLTNHKGEYTLPVGDDNIIFVVKPTGYTFPLDSNNLHQFYYIHKPLGSPQDLKYAGSAPTGKLPKSLDFPLYRQEESNTFQALVFGDPQAYNMEEIAYFKKGIIDDIQATEGISFGISLGDLVGDDLDLHPPYQRAVAELGLPWFNVMGNHDMNFDVKADSLSDETYERYFGPTNFSFNYGHVHFIILDNIMYPHPVTGKSYWGGFREDQLKFVENNLKFVPKDKLIVIAYHIPLFLNDKETKHFRPDDRQRLMDLLAPFPHTVSMSAHTHFQTQVFIDQADGWKRDTPHHEYNVGTTSGDWYSGTTNEQGVPHSTMRDGTPRGYAVLKVDNNQYSFDYRVAGESPTYQIKLIGAEKLRAKYAARHTMYANFFMGAKGDEVQYRIDGADWKDMTYVEEADPDYHYQLLKYDQTTTEIRDGRRPSEPVKSTHLWKVKYPRLGVGTHTFEVRAKDMYGQEHQASKTIVVVE